MVSHFPQICGPYPRSLAIKRSEKSWASEECHGMSHLAIPAPQASLKSYPPGIVTHAEFATVASRRTRVVSAIPKGDGRIITPGVGSSRAIDQDVQLVLRYALRSSDKPEKFGADKSVNRKVGVNVGLQRIIFPQSFQQAPACP